MPVLEDEDFDTDMVGVPRKVAQSGVDEYDLPQPTTRYKQGDGPGAQRKLPVAEFRPDSTVKKGVPVEEIEYNNIFGARQAEEAIEDIKQGKPSRTPGPILVIKNPKGGFTLVDGAHRLEQAKQAGQTAIDIRIADPDDIRQYGAKEFNKLMRPGLTLPQKKAYDGLDAAGQTFYDRLRTEAQLSHERAMKEARKVEEHLEKAAAKNPLGSRLGPGDMDRAVTDIIERDEKKV